MTGPVDAKEAESLLKMLIVEDEKLEREGLLNLLEWEAFGLEVAGAACDGIEGMEMAARIRPDIIITDIKMPGIDGLGMSKKIKEFLPGVKIIILTGYDDFEMAREAISFNVNAYVLKPLEEEELISVLEKVVGECRAERERNDNERSVRDLLEKNINLARAKFLADLLKGNADMEEASGRMAEYGIKAAASGRYCAAVADISDGHGQYPKGCMEQIEELLGDALVFAVAEGAGPKIALCLAVPEDGVRLGDKLEELPGMIREKFVANTAIGLGEPVASLFDVRGSYDQAGQALEHGIFRSAPDVVEYGALDALRFEFACHTDDFLINISYYSRQIVHSVRAGDENRSFGLLEEMFRLIRTNEGAERAMVANCLQNMLNDVSIIMITKDRDFEYAAPGRENPATRLAKLQSLQRMEESTFDFFMEAFEVINSRKYNKDADIIKKVISLIEERYMSDISLKLIAGEVYLSPNYLGNIFRRHTGLTFNEFLCTRRMEKAKELLASPRNKVSMVAEKVGIPNPSYFCTIFKNKYGVTPGEYQETILRK